MAKEQDRTEAPTPKRKREARKEGRIAKSPEVAMWLQLLVASWAAQATFERAVEGLRTMPADLEAVTQDPDPSVALGVLGRGLLLSVEAVLPLALAMVLVGIVSIASQTGLVLATKAAAPKFAKINPIAGLKRLVAPQGMWQGAKSTIKVAVLAGASWGPIASITEDLLAAGTTAPLATAGEVAAATASLTRTVAGAGLVLAVADYAFQRWQTSKSLKMSKKEIRDEARSQEGDPQVKGQIRRRQQDLTRNRMLAAVPQADVVIVNPTHIAVALRYEPGRSAPRVVAKGRGVIADRIREEAARAFVPIVRDIPLARVLERSCRVDQAIPAELYEAVARLLAFVMQVGRRGAALGGVLENPAALALPAPAA